MQDQVRGHLELAQVHHLAAQSTVANSTRKGGARRSHDKNLSLKENELEARNKEREMGRGFYSYSNLLSSPVLSLSHPFPCPLALPFYSTHKILN